MTPLKWLANNDKTLEENLKSMGISMAQVPWRPQVFLGDRNIGFILEAGPSFYFYSEKDRKYIQGPFGSKYDALLALLLFEGIKWHSLTPMMSVEARIRVRAACGHFEALWKKFRVKGYRRRLRVDACTRSMT